MTAWPNDELSKIGAAEEMQIAPRRRDGTLRRPIPVWVVPLGDDLYVRSVNGPTAAWYRAAQASHEGHIQAGGVEQDVTFEEVGPDQDLNDRIDAAYRSKYGRYASIVPHILTPQARSTTLKLVPRS